MTPPRAAVAHALAVALVALSAGCSSEKSQPPSPLQQDPPFQQDPVPGDVTVSPAQATLAVGESLALAARVGEDAGAPVVWQVAEGSSGGAVTQGGVYTAPAAPGVYTVVATSAADPGRWGAATVTVSRPELPEETVDVRDHGAVGDGVADDTAAFRSAAATGKALRVPRPAAYYRLSGPVQLRASMYGVEKPELRMVGASGQRGQHMLEVNDYAGPGLVIRGLRLDGQYDNVGSAGEWGHDILVRGSTNVVIEQNEIVRPYGDGVLVGGEGNPRLSENVVIRGNRFENPRRCTVAVIAGRNVRIEGNTHVKTNPYVSAIDLEPNPYDPEWMEDVVISGNEFDVPGGIAILLWSWKENPWVNSGITIDGNSGRARRFIQKADDMGTWRSIAVTNNTYEGDPTRPGEYIGFIELIQGGAFAPRVLEDVLVQGNVVTASAVSGQTYGDYFRGARQLRVLDNRYGGSAPYSLTVTESPGAVVSGNEPSSIVHVY